MVSSMPVKQVVSRVEPGHAGRTLAALLREAAGVSHAVARGLVDRGLVRVDGRVVTDPASRPAPGSLIETRFDPLTRYHARTASRPSSTPGFRIALEDDHLVVVDKEPGLIAVPAPGHPHDTLADRLVAHYAGRGRRSPRLWIIHRIDRYTSGLVLFAKSESSAGLLLEQFARRTALREYLALCEGIPDPPARRLESWLSETPGSLKMRETRDRKRGLRAICRFAVEERLRGAALVRVTLETGRRNQIRVQMSGIGHPLIGDRKYGRPATLIPRVALHAARLGFDHPATRRRVTVESPLPPDMRRALRRLRQTGMDAAAP